MALPTKPKTCITDATLTKIPKLVTIMATSIVEGRAAPPIVVQQLLMMVVDED